METEGSDIIREPELDCCLYIYCLLSWLLVLRLIGEAGRRPLESVVTFVVGEAPEADGLAMRADVVFPRFKYASVMIENVCMQYLETDSVFKSVPSTFRVIISLLVGWRGTVGTIDVCSSNGTRRIDLLRSLCPYSS